MPGMGIHILPNRGILGTVRARGGPPLQSCHKTGTYRHNNLTLWISQFIVMVIAGATLPALCKNRAPRMAHTRLPICSWYSRKTASPDNRQ